MNKYINVAVIGATGYIGIELIKLLVNHPRVKIKKICAQSSVGKQIHQFESSLKKKSLPRITSLGSLDLKDVDLSDKIIVTNSVDETLVPYVDQAIGLITEENGITSPSAIVGLEKGIPTVVGVENATKEIKNDMLVTVDAANGKVFEGYANVL